MVIMKPMGWAALELLLVIAFFAGAIQAFYMGFQLASDPIITLEMYPYATRDSPAVDLTDCQPGPGPSEQVLGVGIINGIGQGISANTKRKMYGIALWKDADCPGRTPDYIISWRVGLDRMQLADLALAGHVTTVGSWMDLEADNVYLQAGGEPYGYLYVFHRDDEGQRIYVEGGMPVVITGEKKTIAAAKLELTLKSGDIQRAYVRSIDEAIAELDYDDLDDSVGVNTESGGIRRPERAAIQETREDTLITPSGGILRNPQPRNINPNINAIQQQQSVRSRLGSDMTVYPYPSFFPPPQYQPQNINSNMMSNPFPGFSPAQNLLVHSPIYLQGPPERPVLPNLPGLSQQGAAPNSDQITQQTGNQDSQLMTYLGRDISRLNQDRDQTQPADQNILLQDAIRRLAYEIGRSNPMAPVEEVERRSELLDKFLSTNDASYLRDITGKWHTLTYDPSFNGLYPPERMRIQDNRLVTEEEEDVRSLDSNRNRIEEIQMSREPEQLSNIYNTNSQDQTAQVEPQNIEIEPPLNSENIIQYNGDSAPGYITQNIGETNGNAPERTEMIEEQYYNDQQTPWDDGGFLADDEGFSGDGGLSEF